MHPSEQPFQHLCLAGIHCVSRAELRHGRKVAITGLEHLGTSLFRRDMLQLVDALFISFAA